MRSRLEWHGKRTLLQHALEESAYFQSAINKVVKGCSRH